MFYGTHLSRVSRCLSLFALPNHVMATGICIKPSTCSAKVRLLRLFSPTMMIFQPRSPRGQLKADHRQEKIKNFRDKFYSSLRRPT